MKKTDRALPFSVEEFKKFLRLTIYNDVDEDYLTDIIEGVSSVFESLTRITVMRGLRKLYLNGFSDIIEIPCPPFINDVEFKIEYIDLEGNTKTLDKSYYDLDDKILFATIYRVKDKSYPPTADKPNCVTITYTAGYDDCPAAIKIWIKEVGAVVYEHRCPIDAANIKEIIPDKYLNNIKNCFVVPRTTYAGGKS